MAKKGSFMAVKAFSRISAQLFRQAPTLADLKYIPFPKSQPLPPIVIHPNVIQHPATYVDPIEATRKIQKAAFTKTIFSQAELTNICYPCPIPNLGNTCFVASAIQGWLRFQGPALMRKLSDPEINDQDKLLAQTILNTLTQYENTKGNFDLTSFLQVVAKCSCFEYVSGTQQDAAELVTWLENFVQPETKVYVRRNETLEPSALKQDEQILDMGDRIEVPYPGRISISPEYTFSNGDCLISSGQNLLTALKRYFSPQDVRGQNAVLERYVLNTDGIPEERRIPVIERQEILSTAPEELKIEIKRFVSNHAGATHRVGGSLEIPESFTMPADFFEDGKATNYELQSVISHSGSSLHSGHYTASIKTKDGFFFTSDNHVEKISREEMLRLASLGYLLIFRKKT